MAEITASMVKELREKTDAPMMECKKALTEAAGDMAKAEEILRVKLGSKASKAASRVAAEGVVAIDISADGKLGRLQAYDAAGAELGWTTDLEKPLTTGVLATAGGVVFVGDMEPSLKAFDDRSGELLWQSALDANTSSSFITYAVDGRQYLAFVAGMDNLHLRALQGNTRARGASRGGPAIWVFSP